MKFTKLLLISVLLTSCALISGCKDCPKPPDIEECVIESYNGTCFCVNQENTEGKEYPLSYCDGYAATSPTGRIALQNYVESLCKIIKDCD